MAITEIIPIANRILKSHYLCDSCLGRLFSKKMNLSSNKLLGKKLKTHTKQSDKKCFICKNLLDHLAPYLKLMLDYSSQYDFSSLVIGALIKPSIIDRDDYIRSKYKLRGIDSVKTDITKELGKQFIKKTKKTIDFLNPDLTFTINFKDESCQLRSKPILIHGRYTKSKRGLTQKQKSCTNCFGKGCRICNFHGISEYDSVEGKISEFLFNEFGGTIAKFTWVGGEDKDSLVLGSGRPFFVKLQNPLKRNSSMPKKINLDSVVVHNCKIISELPKIPIRFNSSIILEITTENDILTINLKKLKNITSKPVIVYEKSGKRSEKIISDLKYKKTTKNHFTLFIKAEGGLPVKRFVDGDDVTPGICQIMNDNCTCETFDFLDIDLK
ncbi:MAG TPA: tRNA pseudouridine(54/55) synthase Pus10 [Nitrosarchaeum sp.]|jgi:tRNA pseudouridine synthase 10|nr:tRNA pseudouridine(54/55) synthase Pus10 [Nitrosarchaeum sp.]